MPAYRDARGRGGRGEISKKHYADPGAELLRKLGLEPEQQYVRELIDFQKLYVVDTPEDVSEAEPRTTFL